VEDFDFNSGLSTLNCAFGSSMTKFDSLGSNVQVLLKTDPSIQQANCVGVFNLPTNLRT